MAIPTTKEMIAMFNQVNTDCMRDGQDSVPFTDTEYYAEQIETIYDVTELEADALAYQLKEAAIMGELQMEGFNHISAEGIVEFWQLLQTQGTIDLLWDMQPKTKINALMQSENFDMDAHIKTNYCDHDSIVYNYDDICADMLDEMLETIITLEYCFIYDVYNIDFKGRTLRNLDTIPESKVWSPNVYLPITGDRLFTERAEMEKFVMDYFTMDTTDYDLVVTITAHPVEDGDYDCNQVIPFRITGACEYNLMMDLCNILDGEGYILVFTCNK